MKIIDINEIHVQIFLFSIKRVYSELKEIESLMRYILDYPDKELPEKHFSI